MNGQSKIYIAGHTGLVGSAVCRKLSSSGYTNLVFRTHAELDLRDPWAVRCFFQSERPTHVILAAGKVGGIAANNMRRAEFLYDNLMIAANVIHAAKLYDVKKLLNLGSSCIYPRDVEQPIRESTLLSGKAEPTNEPYAIAKIAGIKLCRAMHEQYGCDFFSVTPPNLFGPYDRFDGIKSHVLPALIRKCHLGKLVMDGDKEAIERDFRKWNPSNHVSLDELGIGKDHLTLFGTGLPYREFLHADDLASAVVMLLEQYHATETGEHINVGSGKEISVRNLAALIAEIVGYRGEIRWDHDKPDGTPRKLMDSSRIREIGWKPNVTLENGIRETYQWYTAAGMGGSLRPQ